MGFLALILTAVQKPMAKICGAAQQRGLWVKCVRALPSWPVDPRPASGASLSAVPEGSRSSWGMLHSLTNSHNCECLEHTASVGYCRLEAAGCLLNGTAGACVLRPLRPAFYTHSITQYYSDSSAEAAPLGCGAPQRRWATSCWRRRPRPSRT